MTKHACPVFGARPVDQIGRENVLCVLTPIWTSQPEPARASSGKYRRTRLFVLTLGYSRKSVRLLARRSSAKVWAELH